jgi:hypothetical protein
VSKLPSLAVAVCGCLPWFVHVIESPTWIVIVAGENLKSRITSDGSPAAWGTADEFTCDASGRSPLCVVVCCVVGAAAAVVVCETALVGLADGVAVAVLVDVVVLLVVLVWESELVVEDVVVWPEPELARAEITGRDSASAAIERTIAMRA